MIILGDLRAGRLFCYPAHAVGGRAGDEGIMLARACVCVSVFFSLGNTSCSEHARQRTQALPGILHVATMTTS